MKKLKRFFLIWIVTASGMAIISAIIVVLFIGFNSSASFDEINLNTVKYFIGATIVGATFISPFFFYIFNRSKKFKKEHPSNEPGQYRPNWIKEALKLGTMLFLTMSLILHWGVGQDFTINTLISNIIYWYGFGLVYGLYLKYFGSDK